MTPVQARLFATIQVIVGGIGLSVIVGLVDWRAGAGLFFLLLMAGGLTSLRRPGG